MRSKILELNINKGLLCDDEISQSLNINSTAKLWIQPDQTIYKQYVIWNQTTYRNIEVLLSLIKIPALYQIPEIVMPIHIIKNSEKVVGYTMPFCEGQTLDKFLIDSQISSSIKLQCFKWLAYVISQLPSHVYIGDLHGKNVLVERTGQIHLIDIDGFSLRGQSQTCPLSGLFNCAFLKPKKYHTFSGNIKISRDSDIFCFFYLFLNWIMDVRDFTIYTKKEILRYLSYLVDVNFPIKIVNMIRRLFESPHNYLELSGFDEINIAEIEKYSYKVFVKTKG